MEARLKYSLPKEETIFESAINGEKWKLVVEEFYSWLDNEHNPDNCYILEKLKEIAYNRGVLLKDNFRCTTHEKK